MNDRIITSVIEKRRSPIVAFMLSVLSTGCGQIYNGDASRGISLFLLRLLAVLLVPGYIILETGSSLTVFVVVIAAVNVCIWIGAVVESVLRARGGKRIILKRYNTGAAYVFYIVCTRILLSASMLLIPFFLSLHRVTDDRMEPSLLKGEVVLVNRYAKTNPGSGDIVWFRSDGDEGALRVIAHAGDRAAVAGAVISVNGTVLPAGIFSDDEAKARGLENSEQLFYETAGGRKYPVRAGLADISAKPPRITDRLVPEGIVLAAPDNRIGGTATRMISIKDISGRVEGLVSGKRWKAILAGSIGLN